MQRLTAPVAAGDSTLSTDLQPVLSMEAIKAFSQEQTIDAIVSCTRNQQRQFIELAKLMVHMMSTDCEAGVTMYETLRARGVRNSAMGNAAPAVRVWKECVESGNITEAEFDQLTFADCRAIAQQLGGGRHLRAESLRAAIEESARRDEGPTPVHMNLDDEEVSASVLVHSRGIRISGPLQRHEWVDLLRRWKQCKDNFHFGLADILDYGRSQFGEEEVSAALRTLEYARVDASTAKAIDVMPAPDREHTPLSSGHFRAVQMAGASLAPKERERWLTKAAKFALSPLDLRRSIQAGHVVTSKDAAQSSGRNSGLDTIESVRFAFERWLRRIKAADPISGWDDRRKNLLLEELAPMAMLYREVEASLAKPPAPSASPRRSPARSEAS